MGSAFVALAALASPPFWAASALLASLGAFWLSQQRGDGPDESGGRSGPRRAGVVAAGPATGDAVAAEHLVSHFSHELRGPLNAILGWTQLLEPRRDLPADVQDALKVIRRNAIRQKHLLDDIADLSRVMGGVLAIEPRAIVLDEVIAEACRTIRPMSAAKPVTLTCGPAAVVTVQGDARRLHRAIANLLAHAVRSTSAGGTIRLDTTRRGRNVVVALAANGASLDALARVAARAWPPPAGTPRDQVVSRLELALAGAVIDAHGGAIDSDSAGPDRGAVLTITLPLAAGDAAVTPAGVRSAALRPLAGLRVLAVDDEADWCELLERILTGAGADVKVARSAGDALALARTWRPDVLLTDIAMPGADGYQLLHELRVSGVGDVPAIAMTAHAGAQERARTRAAGFADHLAKPIAPQAVVDAVRRLATSTARTGSADPGDVSSG